jgi:hypothetical protein
MEATVYANEVTFRREGNAIEGTAKGPLAIAATTFVIVVLIGLIAI